MVSAANGFGCGLWVVVEGGRVRELDVSVPVVDEGIDERL